MKHVRKCKGVFNNFSSLFENESLFSLIKGFPTTLLLWNNLTISILIKLWLLFQLVPLQIFQKANSNAGIGRISLLDLTCLRTFIFAPAQWYQTSFFLSIMLFFRSSWYIQKFPESKKRKEIKEIIFFQNFVLWNEKILHI